MIPAARFLCCLVSCCVSAAFAEPLVGARVDALRAHIRENFFVPSPLPALAAKTHRTLSPASGVRAEAVTYATALGMRVPAILYLPDPLPQGGKIPAFIVVNGHGGDKYSWYAYLAGIAYARAGAAVLTYDPAGEGERSASRQSGTRDHDKLKGDDVMARRLAGLMMTDVIQAVSFLASRPEVDASRIAAGGYSMGSFVLGLAGAVEPRLRACVLVGGGNLSGAGDHWDRSKPMCQALPWPSLDFLGDRGGAIYALHAARGPTLVWNGRADTVVEIPKTQEPFFQALRERAAKIRGTADGLFEFGFTDGGSHRPYFVTKPVAQWLERVIDFPNWTEAALRAQPETHLGEWAARMSYPVDKLYATEEREGGARVVAVDVPNITREQLSVFSAAEWERVKRDYTFDVWTERARKL
ncbi:MAG: acetylxylan esterase [Verrucomicrobia bacterium]|nr:acetylxylan esterase [Verrucomicrobiota bacterium]